jgi:hypothetical protein
LDHRYWSGGVPPVTVRLIVPLLPEQETVEVAEMPENKGLAGSTVTAIVTSGIGQLVDERVE